MGALFVGEQRDPRTLIVLAKGDNGYCCEPNQESRKTTQRDNNHRIRARAQRRECYSEAAQPGGILTKSFPEINFVVALGSIFYIIAVGRRSADPMVGE